jgi:hypothetical protein
MESEERIGINRGLPTIVEQMQLSFIFAICQFKYLFCNIKVNA